MMQQRQHIVQRYEDELLRLRSLMEQMGGLVEHQLSLILASLPVTTPERHWKLHSRTVPWTLWNMR